MKSSCPFATFSKVSETRLTSRSKVSMFLLEFIFFSQFYSDFSIIFITTVGPMNFRLSFSMLLNLFTFISDYFMRKYLLLKISQQMACSSSSLGSTYDFSIPFSFRLKFRSTRKLDRPRQGWKFSILSRHRQAMEMIWQVSLILVSRERTLLLFSMYRCRVCTSSSYFFVSRQWLVICRWFLTMMYSLRKVKQFFFLEILSTSEYWQLMVSGFWDLYSILISLPSQLNDSVRKSLQARKSCDSIDFSRVCRQGVESRARQTKLDNLTFVLLWTKQLRLSSTQVFLIFWIMLKLVD